MIKLSSGMETWQLAVKKLHSPRGGGIWLKAMAWRAEDVSERVEALRLRERRNVPERAPSQQRWDTPRQGEAGCGERLVPAGTNDDARTFWIAWDSQGERYKTWRLVCQESWQLVRVGLGLGGEGTALHVAKMMERHGGDPRLWAEDGSGRKSSNETRGRVMSSRC